MQASEERCNTLYTPSSRINERLRKKEGKDAKKYFATENDDHALEYSTRLALTLQSGSDENRNLQPKRAKGELNIVLRNYIMICSWMLTNAIW